ncbi:MAG: hypothetical protein WD530_00775 [Vicingaceae bacterium]
MYTGLLHLHNLLRYVVVILLIIAVVKSFIGWFGKKEYTTADNKISLFLLISVHLQLVIGLVLYFMSPVVETALSDFGAAMKDPVLRFWGVEHIASMVIGIAIITLGRIMAKKGKNDASKFRRQAVYFLLAMVLIFSSIPWPWAAISRAWF